MLVPNMNRRLNTGFCFPLSIQLMSPEWDQEIEGAAKGARQGKFDPEHVWMLKTGYLQLNVI